MEIIKNEYYHVFIGTCFASTEYFLYTKDFKLAFVCGLISVSHIFIIFGLSFIEKFLTGFNNEIEVANKQRNNQGNKQRDHAKEIDKNLKKIRESGKKLQKLSEESKKRGRKKII